MKFFFINLGPVPKGATIRGNVSLSEIGHICMVNYNVHVIMIVLFSDPHVQQTR